MQKQKQRKGKNNGNKKKKGRIYTIMVRACVRVCMYVGVDMDWTCACLSVCSQRWEKVNGVMRLLGLVAFDSDVGNKHCR